MRPAAPFLLGALFGAALGLAGGFVLLPERDGAASGPGAAAPDGVASAPVGARPGAETLVPLAPTPAADRSPARAAPPPAALSPAREDELVRAARPAPVERPMGDGVLEGTATDESGRGVEDVVVRGWSTGEREWSPPAPGGPGRGAPPLRSLDEIVREAARDWSIDRARVVEAVTDSRGIYRFEGLPDEPLRLLAYKEGFVLESEGSARALPGQRVDWVARPVASVRVDVFLPDGTRASQAVLEVETPSAGGRSSRNQYGWTAEEPSLRLEPGPAEVRALAEPVTVAGRRGPEFTLASPQVAIEPALPPSTLRLDLAPRPGVRGTITRSEDGLRGDTPVVFLQRLPAGAAPNLEELLRSDQSAYLRNGDEYAFLGLAPGRYVVGASRAWGSPVSAHGVVEVAGDVQVLDLAIPPIDTGQMITALVLGPTGDVKGEIDFRFTRMNDGSRDASGLRELRTEDGRYLLEVPGESRTAYFGTPEPGTRFALTVMSSELGQVQVPLVAGQTRVEATFAAPARLEVTILGYGGSGYEGRLGVSVEPADPTGVGGGRRTDEPNADGVCVLPALAPGPYRVWLMLESEGRRSSDRRIARTEVELASGRATARLAIPPLYPVHVHAPDNEPGTHLRGYLAEETGLGYSRIEAVLGPDRRAVLSDLVAGRYRLQARGERRVDMEIEVPCGEVLLEDRPIDALRVYITDSEGALARAGLREGDLVIGVDGVEFEAQGDLGRAFARGDGEVRLMLLRRGRSREVRVPAAALRDRTTGRLEPARR